MTIGSSPTWITSRSERSRNNEASDAAKAVLPAAERPSTPIRAGWPSRSARIRPANVSRTSIMRRSQRNSRVRAERVASVRSRDDLRRPAALDAACDVVLDALSCKDSDDFGPAAHALIAAVPAAQPAEIDAALDRLGPVRAETSLGMGAHSVRHY
jgi:hypothetical protein